MSNDLIDRYLDDLRDDVRDLPKRRQDELVAEIKDHIDSALAEMPNRDEVSVRNVLERLGTRPTSRTKRVTGWGSPGRRPASVRSQQ